MVDQVARANLLAEVALALELVHGSWPISPGTIVSMTVPSSGTPAALIARAAIMNAVIGPLSLTTGLPISRSPSSRPR